ATVTVPGSKSLTNRYLVLAALAEEPSRLRRPLLSRDTELMASGLRSLGPRIDVEQGAGGGPDWPVAPGPPRGPAQVACGLAGTVMRFLPAVAALASGPVSFDGDDQARVRPMGPVLAGLRALEVRVVDDGRGTLPFSIDGTGGVLGGAVDID